MRSPFHIHVDASELSAEFETCLLRSLGFRRTDFVGHPPGQEGFEPTHHLTWKCDSSREFRVAFADVVERAKEPGAMTGYIEGEFVAFERDVAPRCFEPAVPLGLQVERRSLPPGAFRESEVHITLSRDRSDPRLIDNLHRAGLFGGYLPKPAGVAEVLTVQGDLKGVGVLRDAVVKYIESAGGAVDCSIKEERILSWWTSGPDVRLPPVMARIFLSPL